MKKIFLIPVLFFSCVAWQAEKKSNWEKEIYTLIENKNLKEALDILESWKASHGEDDPQYWVSGANIWFRIALTPRLEISPLVPGKYVIGPADDTGIYIKDPATGKYAGRISDGPPMVDKEKMEKAVSFLEEGIRRNPHRLDIFTGRAHLYRTAGDLEGEIAALESLVKEPEPLNGYFETGPGKRLEGELEQYQLNMLMSYAREHLQKQDRTNDEAAKAVAELIMRTFPKYPHGYNLMAALNSYENSWLNVEKWLLLALKQDPEDSLVIANLGHCYECLGNIQSAIEQYKRIIDLNKDPSLVERAKARLEALSPGDDSSAD